MDDYDGLSSAVVVRYTAYKARSTSGKVLALVTRLDLAHIMRWSGAIALRDVLSCRFNLRPSFTDYELTMLSIQSRRSFDTNELWLRCRV